MIYVTGGGAWASVDFKRGWPSQRLRVLVNLDEIGLDNRCRLRVAD
jgi:hypothetical protein